MCLVVLSFGMSDEFPLVLAGNRDEFHARPTRDAAWWPDKPDVLGGRDLQAGGTWLALHRSGRFATVTNYRDAQHESGKLKSRGHLVTGFLESGESPLGYLQTIDGSDYAGFNLLVGDRKELAYLSNRGVDARRLEPGLYGLSNATLDAPWHKVERSKRSLQALLEDGRIDEAYLLQLLDDRDMAPASSVQSGRLPFATAHALTAPFIVLPDYGTRCSTTVVLDEKGQWRFCERRFDPSGAQLGESRVTFTAQE